MVSVMPSYANLSYDNLGLTGKLYPNPDPENSDGTVVMFSEKFNTDDGLAHLVPAEWLPAKELPNDEYPFVLNTGRLLEHWHTGSMTRRSFALDTIQPRAQVYIHPADAAELRADGRRDGARELTSRDDRARGQGVAQGGARQLLHPVPLPRGGREPADDRRDRPGREDPRVQVLRRAHRTGPNGNGPREPTDGGHERPRPRPGGARRQVPRSEPDPVAERDPARARLAPARGARPPVPRDAPAAVRDRRAGLVLSALPHGGAAQGRGHGLSRPVVLAARRRRADRRRSTSATATASRSRSARSRASAAATSRRPRPSRSGRSGPPTFRRPSSQALDGDEPPARAKTPPRSWPNDPYAGPIRASGTPPSGRCSPVTSPPKTRSRRSRTPV